MLRNAMEPWHLVILVTAVVLLFGSKRLPDAARSLGKSMRILKSETRALSKDEAGAPAPVVRTADATAQEGPSQDPGPIQGQARTQTQARAQEGQGSGRG
ncbi:Sec-independent protein translocase subunit TatA [Streptomyces sp. NPDC015131]|uniref:Sec-independent protein translocase subunit TatA n=1 Tax=Streptomyces sp. NPDC015131 TaxID=3364941 RepID=UPI0036FAA966